MRFQNVALAVLLVLAGGIFTLLLTQGQSRAIPAPSGENPLGAMFGSPAYGQVAGFTQDFIGVTGRISTGWDALYIFDTKSMVVAAMYYDQSKGEIVPGGSYRLNAVFGRR